MHLTMRIYGILTVSHLLIDVPTSEVLSISGSSDGSFASSNDCINPVDILFST